MTTKDRDYRRELGISREEILEMGRVGAVFYEQGNLQNAQRIFEGLVELEPENADAHSALGAVFTLLKDDLNAIRHLEKSVQLNPDQIAPYVNLGEVYIRQHQLEKAIANLRKAIELDPDENNRGANRARSMILGIYKVLESNN